MLRRETGGQEPR